MARLGWCLDGHHKECWGVAGNMKCACDHKDHTRPHLPEDKEGRPVAKRKGMGA